MAPMKALTKNRIAASNCNTMAAEGFSPEDTPPGEKDRRQPAQATPWNPMAVNRAISIASRIFTATINSKLMITRRDP
jgi:hypothetical protein